MNILVIAPHPDDETIGCGGTLCLHIDRGDRVCVVFLTSGELGLQSVSMAEAKRIREREAERVAEFLGVAEISLLRFPDGYLSVCIPEAAAALRTILQRERPQRIYLPHEYEAHPDHEAARGILEKAIEDNPEVMPALLSYEVWTPLYQYNHAEDISTTMARKLSAIRQYRSQNLSLRFDRACRELNRYRGYLAMGNSYAEVFQYEGQHHRE